MRPPRIIRTWLAVLVVLLCVPAASSAAGQPSIEVTQSRGTVALTEGDDGYELAFSLSAAPASDVVVTLGGAGLVVSPSTLTFEPSSARDPQTVVVTAVDDTLARDAETRTLVATSASDVSPFDGLTREVEVLVLDDDAVALEVDETGSDTTVTEAGAVDTVVVRLGTRPRQPVSVFLEGPGIVAVPDMVVVRPDQWDVGLAVTIAARDDSIENGTRTTTLTARTVAPDEVWSGLTVLRTVSILDDDQHSIRDGGPAPLPPMPVSRANRAPTMPTFRLPVTWHGTAPVSIRFRSRDADGDSVRYRVFTRTHAARDRTPRDWKLMAESTKTTFSSSRIAPFEQRCFRVEAVDPRGEATSTDVSCTTGVADAAVVATNYRWKTRKLRGASNGVVSESTKRSRLVYFTHTGTHAELTFIRCRTCASIRMVDPDGRNRIISLRGTGRRLVTVPLNASGRRIWGFYVHGPGTVLFDSFVVLRPTAP